jgi:hypothetical protein
MFWVTKVSRTRRRSRVTRAPWPGLGSAVQFGDSIRASQARRRTSGSATYACSVDSFSASGFFVHTPSGPRKSGMPESVEIPAPVRTTILRLAATMTRARSTASSNSIAPVSRHR